VPVVVVGADGGVAGRYAMVGVTVLSGADYFLNFRRKLEEASRGLETSQA
jgi:hypothetical protein